MKIMHHRALIISRPVGRWAKGLLLSLVAACMAFFTGCSVVPKDAFDPAGELFQSAIKFQLAEDRWPKDYEDLSTFLKNSDDPAYTSLQAVKFHRLDFISLSGGRLKIDVDYTTASGDATSRMSFVLSTPVRAAPDQSAPN